jgi:nucleotide-binding universal stress UspA family protein
VVSVADSEEAADSRASYAAELFAKHGIEAIAHGIASAADPEEIILAETEALRAAMIAMGASGHGALRSLFLGSTSKSLLRACPSPLFVHH